MNILGLNAYHADASAALVQDGKIIAASEEERFRRIKHWAGLPVDSVRWCLSEGGCDLGDIDVIAVNRDPRANIGRKILYTLGKRPSPQLVADRLRNSRRVGGLSELLEAEIAGRAFHGEVRQVEHHRAHLGSAFLVAPFNEAAVISVDGFGDFASAAWGVGRENDITIDGRVYFPHSLGAFYLTLTQYLGFPKYGDEYKVMGLAPYGHPNFMDEMRSIVREKADGTFHLDLRFFRHHTEDLRYRWDDGAPTMDAHFSPALEELLGPARKPDEELTQRHFDIAHSIQQRFEECVFHMLRMLHESRPLDAIVLSGGGAMNSVANGKITRNTPFREIFVPPAPGDSGGAIGAALVAWHETGAARNGAMTHPYLGQSFDADRCDVVLAQSQRRLAQAGCQVERLATPSAVCETVTDAIIEGQVIGWFQGQMEFGPRALGNRSIICDPRRADMRDIINAKIKLRESFRPFAPSVLREAMDEWFVIDDDVPFMMKVFEIKEDQRSLIPAVTHVDGTGRPHTVTSESNPLYHRLISTFAERTGVPMVLNTSFNENEPIVHRPEEALDCFLRTEMDVLVLGHTVIRKRADP